MTIEPHGGTLINRIVSDDERQKLLDENRDSLRIEVDDWVVSDIYMLAIGGFSPLTGFMTKSQYDSVVENMHLPNGLVFSIPITLGVDETTFKNVKEGQTIGLIDHYDKILHAFLKIEDKFERDVKNEAIKVYLTDDSAHPGVKRVYDAGKYCLGGPIYYVNPSPKLEFPEYNLTPTQTRKLFDDKGWKTVVAFQTRNPIHRAHEYLTKCALEMVDGLLIHPLVGETKSDDIPADIRMECYKVLINKYYNKDRVVLSVLPASMRYGGPKEAIFHAIMRKNYGCTHFIVGRDHAGVGNYYGTYDAQKIFDQIDLKAFGIQPIKFEHTFFCKLCEQMVSVKTCPHDKSNHVTLSGTKVREKLANGEELPHEFTRPEVAHELMKAYRKGN